jgi:hypothetical protein
LHIGKIFGKKVNERTDKGKKEDDENPSVPPGSGGMNGEKNLNDQT